MRQISTRSLPAFLIIPALTCALYGQSSVSLRVQVVDEMGAVIAGARAMLTSADGKKRTAVANASGEITITNLTPGTYTLTVAFNGFETYLEPELKVPTPTQPLKIILKIAPVKDEINVKSEGAALSVEPDRNLNMIILDESFIQTLPDNEEDLLKFLQALAGPAGTGVNGGQSAAQIYIDGFPGGSLPPREAIMQIRINQNPFSAEYSHPGIGRIEIITKPGNDQWRGQLGLSLRNSTLDARNAFAQVKPDLDQKRYSFNFNGPVIKKKMSFFANVERRLLNGSGIVRAQTLDGLFIANVPAPSSNTSFFLRSSYLVNKKNTLNFGYSYVSSESKNREFGARFGGGFGSFGFAGSNSGGGNNYLLPERGSNSENTNHTLQVSNLHLISSRLVHETHLRFQHEQRDSKANTQGVAINVIDAFYGGGSPCCPNQSRQNALDFQDYLTYTVKKHTLKGGLQLEYESNRELNASNFNGTYTFSSLDQYRRVLNGEHLDPSDPNSPPVRPTQFTINRGNPLLRYNQYEAAWFIQDDWRISPNFTFSFGLRHEFQSHLNDKINFAPRLSIAWSPFKDRKTVLRAGGGIFFNRLSGNIYENTLRYNGVTQQSIIIRNPPFPDPFAGNLEVSLRNTIKRVLDPNLKAPYTIHFTASLERQLPFGLMSSLTYIYAKGVHQFRSRNINAPLAGTNERPDPTQGNIYQIESSAKSQFNGLLFRLDRRLGRSFTVFSNYTLSWTMNDADGPLSLPADNYNLRPEWGPASSDRRHHLFIGGNVILPYSFRLTPFVAASSGAPFNITTGFDDNHDTVINDRPPGVNRNSDFPARLYPLLPDRCIASCGPGQTPVMLHDFLRRNFPNGVRAIGPSSFNVNLSVSKTFGFGQRGGRVAQGWPGAQPEGQEAEASDLHAGPSRRGDFAGRVGRAGFGSQAGREGFGSRGRTGRSSSGSAEASRFNFTISTQITNLFNHVNLGQRSGVLSSPFFNRSNSAGPARQFEFNLRFGF
jgi:outer membrane receptor for ferrienterochelin and colicin